MTNRLEVLSKTKANSPLYIKGKNIDKPKRMVLIRNIRIEK